MSIPCEVILSANATPAEVSAVAAGLWRVCAATAGTSSIYRLIDNQAFADLLRGRLPEPTAFGDLGRSPFRFTVRDHASSDRRTTITVLQREMPVRGIDDILVSGTSWDAARTVFPQAP